jgi:hypothetical protein
MDLASQSDMIILGSLLTTFEASVNETAEFVGKSDLSLKSCIVVVMVCLHGLRHDQRQRKTIFLGNQSS